MNVKTIGLVQICETFQGHQYFPYTVGLLQAYAQKYASNSEYFRFLEPIFSKTSVEDAVEHLAEADIVGLSLYI